jgi:large subunit ribosomal protein L25
VFSFCFLAGKLQESVMAETVQLEVQTRNRFGTQAAARLRRQGLLPAVVYGHKQATLTIAIKAEDFQGIVRHGVRLVELKTDGSAEQALIQEVQWDHLGKEVLHVDFRRVSKDERVVLPVPIHLRGQAPGVSAGGILDQPLHVLEVECLASAVPEAIRLSIGELQIGAIVHVRELPFPPGVQPMADPDAIVVQIVAPQAPPEEAAAPAPEQAEPEVIGRAKPGEESEEE